MRQQSFFGQLTKDECVLLIEAVREGRDVKLGADGIESFCDNATEDQIAELFELYEMDEEEERSAMKNASLSALTVAYRMRHFFQKNISWAFRQERDDVTEKVLDCLESQEQRPDEEDELAFVKKAGTPLLKAYLDKFGALTEAAEKVLNEDTSLRESLSAYLEWTLEKW